MLIFLKVTKQLRRNAKTVETFISPTAFWGIGNFYILKCHFVTFNSATVLLLCRVSFQFIVLYIMYMIYYISLWCITRFLNTTECCTLQSQPDLAGYAAPHSINLQEEQPLWPLPKASLEIQWRGVRVQPFVWLWCPWCWCHGGFGSKMETSPREISLHGRKCQERRVNTLILFIFSFIYVYSTVYFCFFDFQHFIFFKCLHVVCILYLI